MPRTNVASQAFPTGSYPALPLAGGSADLVWTAADVANGNMTPLVNNKTVVLVRNTDTGAHNVSFTSAPDTLNRTGDISNYSLAAGKVAAFGPFQTTGWAVSSNLEFNGADATVEFAVVQLP